MMDLERRDLVGVRDFLEAFAWISPLTHWNGPMYPACSQERRY
ncbi:hypothetical protein [Paraburkholderia pallida]|nr:hypothetical protein [Paraburkholderia pallida]